MTAEFAAVRAVSSTFPVSIVPPGPIAAGAFPHFVIPPDDDVRLTVRLGSASIIDSVVPLLYKHLDQADWASLACTYALNVVPITTSFHDLFPAVQRASRNPEQPGLVVDVAIASASAVMRAQMDVSAAKLADNPPKAVLPILQQFSAIYIFTKDVDFAHAMKQQIIAYIRPEKGQSVHALMRGTPDCLVALRSYISECEIFVERGADLDVALLLYWMNGLLGDRGSTSIPARLTGGADGTISTTFEKFTSATGPSFYMGGLAQTSYLLNRCGLGREYVLLAGPDDIQFENVNSFVCTARFGDEHRNDLIRLYNWWFDLLNRFRRYFLFAEDAVNQTRLRATIRKGLTDAAGNHVDIIPPHFDDHDLDRLLDFMRAGSPSSSGSFLIPNFNDAINSREDVRMSLRQINAVVEVLPADERNNPGGNPSQVPNSEAVHF